MRFDFTSLLRRKPRPRRNAPLDRRVSRLRTAPPARASALRERLTGAIRRASLDVGALLCAGRARALSRLRDLRAWIARGWACGRTAAGRLGTARSRTLSRAGAGLTAGTSAFRDAAVRARRRVTQGLTFLRTTPSRTRAALLSWRERRRAQPAGDDSRILRPQGYRGSRARYYVVHVPPAYRALRARPLVMVLHGCRQTHRDIEAISGFNRLADRHGFIAVYPYITSYRGLRFHNCWGWWFEREIRRGAGEVEDLWQIVERVRAEYRVHTRRIHVVGLSSGGGMAAAMMVAHSDRIASGAVVAGVPYSEWSDAVRVHPGLPVRHKPLAAVVDAMQREMGARKRLVPVFVAHSHDDRTVGIRAGENLRDSWGRCFGIETGKGDRLAGRHGEATWEHASYRDANGNPAIQTLFLHGPGHGWYGGSPGPYSFPEAPDVAALSWRFFRANPLPRR